MDFWAKGYSTERDRAIDAWERIEWLHAHPDSHLEWVTHICDCYHSNTTEGQPKGKTAPEQWVENVERAERILRWRRLGEDGPFR